MPEMQMHSSVPAAAAVMPVEALHALRLEDCDFALGCECANPALQIERWSQEASCADLRNG